MTQLRLPSCREEYRRQLADASVAKMSFDDRLELIFSAEINDRSNRRTLRRLREANLRLSATPEEFDTSLHRGISKSEFSELLSLSFVRNHHNLAITGPCGVGKTYLACALGTQGARHNYSIKYLKSSTLIEKIGITRLDGTYRSYATKLFNTDILIIDDWGLSPITVNGSRELLEIIDDRCDEKSTIISSQLPVDKWHNAIEDKTAADAIIDRFINSCRTYELTGESMRKKKTQINLGTEEFEIN